MNSEVSLPIDRVRGDLGLRVAELGLCAVNQRFFDAWMSMWEEGRPPSWRAFHPAQIKELLVGLAIVDVFPDGGSICRLAGTALEDAVGRSGRGLDLLEGLSEAEKAIRQRRQRAIVDGTLAVARTRFTGPSGERRISENLFLPLSGGGQDACRQFVMHGSVRPTREDREDRPAEWHLGLPDEYIELPLRDPRADPIASAGKQDSPATFLAAMQGWLRRWRNPARPGKGRSEAL